MATANEFRPTAPPKDCHDSFASVHTSFTDWEPAPAPTSEKRSPDRIVDHGAP